MFSFRIITQTLSLSFLPISPFSLRDYVYNGYYINSVDSGNYNTAKSFNYHQAEVRHAARAAFPGFYKRRAKQVSATTNCELLA